MTLQVLLVSSFGALFVFWLLCSSFCRHFLKENEEVTEEREPESHSKRPLQKTITKGTISLLEKYKINKIILGEGKLFLILNFLTGGGIRNSLSQFKNPFISFED